MTIHRSSAAAAPSTADQQQSVECPSTVEAARADRDTEPLTKAEQAVWRDAERLARIEAVLDDSSLAVPLDELD